MQIMRTFSLMLVTASIMLSPAISNSASPSDQQEMDIVVYSGYYVREGSEGKTAKLSGKSHYIKFYPENRVIKLYIPYPYSSTLSPEVIRKVFTAANKQSLSSSFIRDKFGILGQPVVAHLDTFRRVDGEVQYDCSNSAPCKIIFSEGALHTIKKAIVGEHVIKFDYVKE